MPPGRPPLLPPSLRPWHGALLILCLGLLVYGRVVDFTLVTGDDWTLIAGNRLVTRWADAPLSQRLLTPIFGYPIPVTVLSFAADWALYGGRPAGLHLTNLSLHILCALTFFRVLLVGVSAPAALCGALLFLLHPVQVEAVAFVTQRKDLLATLLSLLALLRVVGHGRGATPAPGTPSAPLTTPAPGTKSAPGTTPAPGAPTLSAFALVLLAGLSKPSALLLGPLLAAAWLVLRGTPRRRSEWALCLLLPAAAALLAALGAYVHRLNPVSLDGTALPPALRAALVTGALHHYLRLLALPLELAPRVPRPQSLDAAAVLATLLSLGLFLVAAGAARRRRHRLVLLWLLGSYLPISNLLPINRYAADSYLYLVMPAPAAALALWLQRRQDRRPPERPDGPGAPEAPPGPQGAARAGAPGGAAVPLLLALWLAVLAVLSHRQCAVWRDDLSLRAYLYHLYPEQHEAMKELVHELGFLGRRREALLVKEEFLRRALAHDPAALVARHQLLGTRLLLGDRAGARRALLEAPPAQREKRAYLAAQLELAMAEGDKAAARAAVGRLLAQELAPAQRAELEALLRRLSP